eukprot:m.136350 g.136350  ORF g.136350 m.136350 type:complete len:50 (+) comp16970_c0_seq3:3090-3239(+)
MHGFLCVLLVDGRVVVSRLRAVLSLMREQTSESAAVQCSACSPWSQCRS